jgi:hypothetical protein
MYQVIIEIIRNHHMAFSLSFAMLIVFTWETIKEVKNKDQ